MQLKVKSTGISMHLAELKTSGWTIVEGVSSSEELLDLGRALGSLAASPNGEMIKEIRISQKTKAPPGSQSALYGTGPFPLHTDTAFWPVPIRYVILRAYGDVRRPTTVMSCSQLFQQCGKHFYKLVEKSVWTVGTKSKRFYCSLRFRHDDSVGWRYDADLMSPANAAAREIDKMLRPLVDSKHTEYINWSDNTAVVLSNWDVFHGRGPEPHDEGARTIERLYVR